MKTLLTFIIGFGLTLTSFGDLTNRTTGVMTGQTTDGMTNQTISTDSLVMRTYKVNAETFVANLKYLMPPRPGESNTALLIRYFKQKHIEIKPAKSKFLNEKKNLLFALAPKEDQDKIKHVIIEITYTHKNLNSNDF